MPTNLQLLRIFRYTKDGKRGLSNANLFTDRSLTRVYTDTHHHRNLTHRSLHRSITGATQGFTQIHTITDTHHHRYTHTDTHHHRYTPLQEPHTQGFTQTHTITGVHSKP